MEELNKLTIALNYLEGYLLGYSDDIAEHVKGCITIAESLCPHIRTAVDEKKIEFADLCLKPENYDTVSGYLNSPDFRKDQERRNELINQLRSLEGGEGKEQAK